MTREVYPREKIAHLWVHRTQDSARTSSGNFYFSGAALYSYGSHFVCGFLLPDAYNAPDGSPCVLVNADRYSNTTGRHMDSMRQAIPRYYRRIAVEGLNENNTRTVNRCGIADIAAALVGSFRDAVKGAATERNVKRDTRAASMAIAGDILANARFLLECDTQRRDIAKEYRAKARAMLRGLPESVPELPDASREAAEAARAFAATILRETYREDMQRALQTFERASAQLEHYAAHGPAAPYSGYVSSAADALRQSGDAASAMKSAKHAAKLGRARIPASVRKRAAAIAADVARLEYQDVREQRAGAVLAFTDATNAARVMIATEPGTWRMDAAVNAVRNAAYACAALDTEAEREARNTETAELERMAEAARSATAPERARALLDVAARYREAGKLDNARDSVTRAGNLLRDTETAEPETVRRCNDMLAAIDAREAAANAERIEQWRNGANVSLPHHGAALLRVNGDVIETSQGADVPLSVAPKVWQAVNAVRARGEAREFAHETAPRLGHFRLNSIAANGDITAGCHVIEYAELARVAASLGYPPGGIAAAREAAPQLWEAAQ